MDRWVDRWIDTQTNRQRCVNLPSRKKKEKKNRLSTDFGLSLFEEWKKKQRMN